MPLMISEAFSGIGLAISYIRNLAQLYITRKNYNQLKPPKTGKKIFPRISLKQFGSVRLLPIRQRALLRYNRYFTANYSMISDFFNHRAALSGIALVLASLPGVSKDLQAAKTGSGGRQPVNVTHKLLSGQSLPGNGLFTVYRSAGKYYFQIPDSLLNREMLVVTRLAKTPGGLSVNEHSYAGEKENQQVWKWERRKDQVLIRVPGYSLRADQDSPEYPAVSNSNFDNILFAFDIISPGKDSNGLMIDVTDFYNSDNPATGISDKLKKALQVSALDNTRSYIDTIKTFPSNVEVRTVKTYKAAAAPTDKTNASVSFELNTSMVLLPRIPAKARLRDDRIGYMHQDQNDFSADPHKVEVSSFIHRWKLVPKDSAAYAGGELVEPVKPVIFYVDPATPAKWVPYFIQGINDWQKAFEAAGFKNAIIGKKAPTVQEDPGFNPEDARYSMIRYLASDIQNAYGDHIADPRTGEIIVGQVNWYANQPEIFYDLLFVQTAAANPQARTVTPSDEMIGRIIRYVCSHEVGHSLGLSHNWGANYAFPVDSLRSKNFTSQHGTSASIMDYSRFNYVAQPGDGVTQFFPQMGAYDAWAIQWGYSWLPGGKSPQEERQTLNTWTKAKAGDPLYFFGKEFTGYDPRTQNEDIGDNAVKAGNYGIANLSRVVPNLEKWTYEAGKDPGELRHMYNRVIDEYYWMAGHVITSVGGMYVNFKTYDENLPGYTHVGKVQQKDAVNFLNRQVFRTPYWLIDKKELSDIDNGVLLQRIKNTQVRCLEELLDASRLARMYDNEIKNGTAAYSVKELLTDISHDLFAENTPDAFRRNLQRAFVQRLGRFLTEDFKTDAGKPAKEMADQGDTPINIGLSDLRPLVRSELSVVGTEVSKKVPGACAAHFADLKSRIRMFLNDYNKK